MAQDKIKKIKIAFKQIKVIAEIINVNTYFMLYILTHFTKPNIMWSFWRKKHIKMFCFMQYFGTGK